MATKKCSRCRGAGSIMVHGMRQPTRCPRCAGTGETPIVTQRDDTAIRTFFGINDYVDLDKPIETLGFMSYRETAAAHFAEWGWIHNGDF